MPPVEIILAYRNRKTGEATVILQSKTSANMLGVISIV
jgi:hypothetical protein